MEMSSTDGCDANDNDGEESDVQHCDDKELESEDSRGGVVQQHFDKYIYWVTVVLLSFKIFFLKARMFWLLVLHIWSPWTCFGHCQSNPARRTGPLRVTYLSVDSSGSGYGYEGSILV